MAMEDIWAVWLQIPWKNTVAVRIGFDSRNIVCTRALPLAHVYRKRELGAKRFL